MNDAMQEKVELLDVLDAEDDWLIDLDQTPIDFRLCFKLGCVDAIRLGCIPVRRAGAEILVAVMSHTREQAIAELPWLLHSPIRLVVVDCATIARAIQQAFSPLDASYAVAS